MLNEAGRFLFVIAPSVAPRRNEVDQSVGNPGSRLDLSDAIITGGAYLFS
jgi:hypothetical protein